METIDTLYKEWLSLQPMKDADKKRLEQKFMLEFNYNSSHIEGNTLTYGQTKLLLLFGQVVDAANMRDLEEMKAHNVGLKMVEVEAADKERPLTEAFIRELHRTLLREDYEVTKNLTDGTTTTYKIHAGCYKTRPNSVKTVTGELFEYASPEETPALMTDLIAWYNDEARSNRFSAIELASIFHYRYIRIHPFEDGNGRIARLLVNYILLRHNYPMIVVRSQDKEKYLMALHQADINVGATPSLGAHAELEQITDFVQYMAACLERALTTCIKAAKGESIEEEEDWSKRLKLLAQEMENKPARTTKLTTQAIRESFIHVAESTLSTLLAYKSLFFSIEATTFYGGNFRLNAPFNNFKQYAESKSTTFQRAVKIDINIQIAEILAKYIFKPYILCTFHEFSYEIKAYNSKETQSIKKNYGVALSEEEVNYIVNFIGQGFANIYEAYVKDNNK